MLLATAISPLFGGGAVGTGVMVLMPRVCHLGSLPSVVGWLHSVLRVGDDGDNSFR